MEWSEINVGWSWIERREKKKVVGEAWLLRLDWWNVTVEMGKEACPEEK